ncbi:unknown [Clostridium sp. CAG:465]|nr:unknown [Clostridium sp. CAG:465]
MPEILTQVYLFLPKDLNFILKIAIQKVKICMA